MTSVARVLQQTLPGLWLQAGVDMFWGMLDELWVPDGRFRADSDVMRRITRGWHRAVAALAAEGNDVIVDELWTHRWWLDDWHEVLDGLRWWAVMLMASAEALAVRESQRGWPQGLAAGDLASPPDPGCFDLVIDTTDMTVADCAAAIARLVGGAAHR
jgi:chloramphenicol 3-O phosphotransferase